MTTTAEILENSIRATIRKLKRDGVTGMSYANLKQITPTDGLSCAPSEYHREFPRVSQYVAMNMKFDLYHVKLSAEARARLNRAIADYREPSCDACLGQ